MIRLLVLGFTTLAASCVFMFSAAQALAQAYLSEDGVVEATDGRQLAYTIDRPSTASGKLPLLIVIDGSGCVGHKRAGFSELLAPSGNPDIAYARLVVGKSGVPATKAASDDCSDTFMEHYAIDQRVLDHLRILQVLTREISWWNGQLVVFGWSDGGDIATQLFAYNPKISRLAFGGVGGGFTMQEHFEDFWVCAEGQIEDREGCVASLREQFDAIDRNPTWTEHWSGEDNSYRAWRSRLSTRLTPILQDETRPVLMVHGAEDYTGAPVQSARKLADDLRSTATFTYWEIEGMGHDIWSLPPEKALALEARILRWLFEAG